VTSVGPDAGRLGLLGKTASEAFLVRVVALPPGSRRVFDERDWRDSLVEVACGELELELRGGARQVHGAGGVLWLAGLPIVALGNPGCDGALLVAASRRRIHRPEDASRIT
jgi:hypothetical protein